MNFNSTAYEWLVVAGAKAQYKGEGTINGAGNYGFMLTAIDDQLNGGGGTDKFRIKIWNKATNATVYDNNIGSSDNALRTTAVGGGSIVIHDPKKSDRIADQTEMVQGASPLKAYPNPFRQKITVEFSFAQEEDYTLNVYDIRGRLVKRLQSGKAKAGSNLQATWEAKDAAQGVYIIQLITSHGVQNTRVVHE